MTNAAETYAVRHFNALALLSHLQGVIEDMPEPESDGINWGHAGSMGHICAQLSELLAFAGGNNA